MTRKSLLSFAAALVAATSLSGVAEAGNGVRLGFGGPLGTFVATPAGGGGGGHYAAKSHSQPKVAHKKQNTATPSVARVMTREEPRAEKPHKSSPRKAVADSTDSKVTKTVRKSRPVVETTSIAHSKTDKVEKDETVTDTAADSSAPVSGAQALANQDAQPEAAAVTTEPAKTETETAAETAAEATTTTETVVAAHEETKATETTITEATAGIPAKTAEKIDETKDVGCKKFIPAIGVTVSIGCGK